MESGLDEALRLMNKGYTTAEAEHERIRLKAAGIDYGANIIFGSAGPELRMENALKTAELINKTKPYLFFTGTIHADPGCPLYDRLQSEEFRESSIGEHLEEEETFLNALDVADGFNFGLHPSNVVALYGNLGTERRKMFAMIDQKRKSLSEAQLASQPVRRGEGAIIL